MRRRKLLGTAALLPGCISLGLEALAATPEGLVALQDLRFIVSSLPGAAPDLIARAFAQALAQSHKLAVTILNVEGAAGEIALRRLGTEPPDGRTWMLAQESIITINPSFYPRNSNDILEEILPIALVATSNFYVLVRSDDPIASFKDFLLEARSASLPMAYGSGGIGSLHHLSMEGLATALDLKLMHVPYKGNVRATQALVRGDVRILVAGTSALSLVETGRLRMIAISSARRTPTYAEVPALAEFVPGFQATNWFGFFARKGVPEPLLNEMRGLLQRATEGEEMRRTIKERGNIDPTYLTGRAFGDLIASDRLRFAAIAQRSSATTKNQ